MWKKYIKEKIISEKETLDRLFKIDNEENGTNYSVDYLISIIDKNIKLNINNKVVIIEGNSFILINLLELNIDKIIINTMNNYSINKWISKKYNEYENKIKIVFNESFNEENITFIGSKPYIAEMKSMVPNASVIVFDIE